MDLAGLPVTLLDTAGLRDTRDKVEEIGIARARQRAAQADLRVFLVEGGESPDFEPQPDDIILRAKADLLLNKDGAISGLSGEGIANLIEKISYRLSLRAASIGVATRERHRLAMVRAVEAMNNSLGLVSMEDDMTDIAAEELRTAIRALDSLVGRVDVENLLDEIFSSFCVGK